MNIKRSATVAILIIVGIILAAGNSTGAGSADVKASAFAPIERGNLSSAQKQALEDALSAAMEKTLQSMIPPSSFQSLAPLLQREILDHTQDFIANYHILDRDVSDLAYTVHISARIDMDLLRKQLTRTGIMKGPGSPPLAAVFVTVDAPVNLQVVEALGTAARDKVTASLERSGIVVIPVGEDNELGFRVIRPPQDAESLRRDGAASGADLAVGAIIASFAGSKAGDGSAGLPVEATVQVIEVASGSVVEALSGQTEAIIQEGEKSQVKGDIHRQLEQLAQQAAATASARFVPEEVENNTYRLLFADGVPAFRAGRLLYELSTGLEETAAIIPSRFGPEGAEYTVWTPDGPDRFQRALARAVSGEETATLTVEENRAVIGLTEAAAARTGVREYGEEVTFYRRLPVAGMENPDDVRKIELVQWHETEENDSFPVANDAPLDMGILGKIEPSADHDMFRFAVPRGVTSLSITVEHTGPVEIKPRIRVYSAGGSLLANRTAVRRGRSLRFTMTLPEAAGDVVVALEDDLGRYAGMFPYVLRVTGVGASPGDHEPS